MKDYEPGVTAPPFHVNCRSTTAPYFDDDFDLKRSARDEDGKVYEAPGNMTYRQWRGKQNVNFEEKSSNFKNPTSNAILRTYDDPIREKIGSAEESNPKELKEIKEFLNSKGVDIVIDISGRNIMGYMPNPVAGKPGKIVMENGASISAWMHEKRHVVDDELHGWQGFRIMENLDLYESFENNAYQIEIDFAKK